MFHVCSRCGAVPLVTSEIANHLYAVVNVNVLENVDQSSVHRATADFEGEDVNPALRAEGVTGSPMFALPKGAPNLAQPGRLAGGAARRPLGPVSIVR